MNTKQKIMATAVALAAVGFSTHSFASTAATGQIMITAMVESSSCDVQTSTSNTGTLNFDFGVINVNKTAAKGALVGPPKIGSIILSNCAVVGGDAALTVTAGIVRGIIDDTNKIILSSNPRTGGLGYTIRFNGTQLDFDGTTGVSINKNLSESANSVSIPVSVQAVVFDRTSIQVGDASVIASYTLNYP
jgi:type 1 fimbria pilin